MLHKLVCRNPKKYCANIQNIESEKKWFFRGHLTTSMSYHTRNSFVYGWVGQGLFTIHINLLWNMLGWQCDFSWQVHSARGLANPFLLGNPFKKHLCVSFLHGSMWMVVDIHGVPQLSNLLRITVCRSGELFSKIPPLLELLWLAVCHPYFLFYHSLYQNI